MATMTQYLKQFMDAAAEAKSATQRRYDEASAIYDQNIASYQPGGAYEQGAMGQLSRAREKTIASSEQALVSSGLYNTSLRGNIGKKFEEDVGTPFRLSLEDTMLQRLTAATSAKAGLLERVNDIGPDAGLMAQLMQSAQAEQNQGKIVGSMYGGVVGPRANQGFTDADRAAGHASAVGNAGVRSPGWGLYEDAPGRGNPQSSDYAAGQATRPTAEWGGAWSGGVRTDVPDTPAISGYSGETMTLSQYYA